MKLPRYSSNFSKKQIILLSIPVFFSNLAVPLVGMVDTGLMGNLGETKYLAATSIATSVMSMIIWSFGFLRMGTTGLVAQAKGSGDQSEVFSYLIRGVLIGFVVGVVLLLLQIPLFWFALHIFQAMPEVESQAKVYLNIRVWSAPLSIANFAVLGWLIALEKTFYVLLLHPLIHKRFYQYRIIFF